MPRRDDIKSICILGSGPIVIGQACEFDYSGTQAIRVLKNEGYRVILVNSNPATIMTDPQFADATYIEPLTPDYVAQVLRKERPDALLPTMGGQTALNLALKLHADGVLDELGIELLAASPEVIDRAEDREQFHALMREIGVEQPKAGVARSLEEAWEIQQRVGFPAILRPSYTMGGSGGNIAYNREEFERYVKWSLQQSPNSEVLIDESLIGWKELEMELMRDKNDNIMVICGIENIDPLGVHTGDSSTVAPIQTMSERELEAMRNDSFAIIRAVGVECGGCNIQFAVDPKTGRRVVIEMNPRVSRSSALASKATGYPIAKVAALVAVGYTLDEITNDITGTTAAFEPVLDYVIVKIPSFAFDKFPEASDRLSTQMKAVGEVMSIGRTFPEAMQKAVRSLETKSDTLRPQPALRPLPPEGLDDEKLVDFFRPLLMNATPARIWHIFDALRAGMSVEAIQQLTHFDPWFLDQFGEIIACEAELRALGEANGVDAIDKALLFKAKRLGFSDRDVAFYLSYDGQSYNARDLDEDTIRARRQELALQPVFKQVDTCAGEFDTVTSYFYSTYERGENEALASERPSVLILGSGPIRIGQGIEFDYCAVHAALSLREAGYRTIMLNCNPETVSTDYDISDRLYFEPLTFENVMEIIARENPIGVILQFGGQTPLKLANKLDAAGVRILGTDHAAIHRTEDREEFNQIVTKLGLKQPEARLARSLDEAMQSAIELGYPLLVRPSYVLGGLGMQIVHEDAEMAEMFAHAQAQAPDSPVLIDRFLNQAVEVDVDCISDGKTATIAGILEHIEAAGVHSGDSACVTPPYHLSEAVLRVIREQTLALAKELEIVGLMNVQFAVLDQKDVYILEVNPRASRTVPFIAKAIGMPLPGLAARCMLGESLADLGYTEEVIPRAFFAKESVLPFAKFPEVDTVLGPEMRSTGEVMGIDADFNLAYLKAQIGGFNAPPTSGRVFISVRDADKWASVPMAKKLETLGFELVATRGTARYLSQNGLNVATINKVKEGQPHIADAVINGDIALVINTTTGAQAIEDSRAIRRATVNHGVPYCTQLAAGAATVDAMVEVARQQPSVKSLQEYHRELKAEK
ncbi:carbamoyl-phosphate synthase large subunit [Bradymonas sediminis]|uniref:Carbamoyl phosphate synthase large chain n=1 Tax=Bradymonas sediminis TaxID=1548548 RepID=A0A2Z4FLH2_9DELT|nr:carbamoyl-phosphate synthase large subunit [Bradymonas sediminis]AWV89772.1 carbamoyl phosphate synthase large subunit [Bradymonas sediminis]TDP76483.1 carbamoyl-phosphate synthase large subunit [Bradymonas sediminis]